MPDHPHWTQCRAALRHLLTARRFGVISDFDGTLSHFVVDASFAQPTPAAAAALVALIQRGATVALVSGRTVADLRTRFAHPAVLYYGNHGLEHWQNGAVQVVPEARQWVAPLRALLAELTVPAGSGIVVENKGVTASVHYRAAADPAAVGAMLAAQLQPLGARYGLRLSAGNRIWEIKPPVALDKGTATRAIVQARQLDSVIFCGDDTTDLSAMAALRQMRAAGELPLALVVGVVHRQGTPPGLLDQSDLTANGPDDVAGLLAWLAARLPTGQTSAAGAERRG
jgi:trehalose 6-phosphate phosphatase